MLAYVILKSESMDIVTSAICTAGTHLHIKWHLTCLKPSTEIRAVSGNPYTVYNKTKPGNR